MPTQFVRIRDTASGVETSVSEARAKQLAERHKGVVEILRDVEATDRLGRPLPASRPEVSKQDAPAAEVPELSVEPAADAPVSAKTTPKSKEQAR